MAAISDCAIKAYFYSTTPLVHFGIDDEQRIIFVDSLGSLGRSSQLRRRNLRNKENVLIAEWDNSCEIEGECIGLYLTPRTPWLSFSSTAGLFYPDTASQSLHPHSGFDRKAPTHFAYSPQSGRIAVQSSHQKDSFNWLQIADAKDKVMFSANDWNNQLEFSSTAEFLYTANYFSLFRYELDSARIRRRLIRHFSSCLIHLKRFEDDMLFVMPNEFSREGHFTPCYLASVSPLNVQEDMCRFQVQIKRLLKCVSPPERDIVLFAFETPTEPVAVVCLDLRTLSVSSIFSSSDVAEFVSLAVNSTGTRAALSGKLDQHHKHYRTTPYTLEIFDIPL